MGSKRRLPQMAGGSASALSLSRPAQASLTLRPAGSLSRPEATFVTRLQPMRLPAQAARQLPDQSTTLRVDSSSTDDSRLRGALPQADMARSGATQALHNLRSSAILPSSEFACPVAPCHLTDTGLCPTLWRPIKQEATWQGAKRGFEGQFWSCRCCR